MMNFAEHTMGRTQFKSEPILLRNAERNLRSTKSLAGIAEIKAEFGKSDLHERDSVYARRADGPQGNLLEHPIENPLGVVGLSQLQVGERNPSGRKKNRGPFSNLPGHR